MIGYLHGKVLLKQPPALILDVNGVGYELETSMNTFYHLPEIGHEISLYTHLVVRDDAHLLYGFFEQRERKLFRALIKVSGVGPKLALAILSSIDPDNFVACVSQNDTASLVRIPGVGKKTAERLIIEMRDRLRDWFEGSELLETDLMLSANNENAAIQEAISALLALGYKQSEAEKSVRKVFSEGESSKELIRSALKQML